MRLIASCLSEYATHVVSDHASCSTSATHSWISPKNLKPSTQTSVSSLYKTTLSSSTHKTLLITTTWTKTHTTQNLTITFNNPPQTSFKLTTASTLFRKKKGTKQLETPDGSKIDLSWDLTAARYNSGRPEPIDGFHVSILVNSELALTLGMNKSDAISTSKNNNVVCAAKTSLVSRREYFSGNALYATKARFREGGVFHDVLIHCGGEKGNDEMVLSVCVDKKIVVRVKRLRWNFRGNQMVFVDGLLVDMMWDVHDWFFGGGTEEGFGVFMFRRRSGTESSRLWLEEKVVGRKEVEKEKVEFSLVIYACKSP